MSKVTLEDAAIELEDAPLAQPELAALVRAADDVVKAARDIAVNPLLTPGQLKALCEAVATLDKISNGE